MHKYIKQGLNYLVWSNLALLLTSLPAMAANNPTVNTLQNVGANSGFAQQSDPKQTFSTLIGQVVQAFLALLGVIFLVLMLYAGYNWMTAAGDETKVAKAKDTLRQALIGIIVTAGAFGIWKFVAQFIL